MEPREFLQHGMEMLEQGRLQEALEVLESGLTRYPRNGWLRLRMAETHIRCNAPREAIDILQSLDAGTPALGFARTMALVDAYLNLGDHHQAKSILERADPDSAAANRRKYAVLLGLYQRLGATQQAQYAIDVLAEHDAALSAFFRKTLARRVRTNSLYSPPVSADYNDTDAASQLLGIIRQHVVDRRGFSMIRLGDGEGQFMRQGAHKQPQAHDAFLQSLNNADILGLPREDMCTGEYRDAIKCLMPATVRRLIAGEILLTDCHCHYALEQAGLSDFLKEQDHIGFIGGRDLRDFFGNSVTSFVWYPTPLEGVPRDQSEVLESIIGSVSVPHAGAVFLVGAGIFGKIYCEFIKQQGGVALDIGALADLWSGLRHTRPYIRRNMQRLAP